MGPRWRNSSLPTFKLIRTRCMKSRSKSKSKGFKLIRSQDKGFKANFLKVSHPQIQGRNSFLATARCQSQGKKGRVTSIPQIS